MNFILGRHVTIPYNAARVVAARWTTAPAGVTDWWDLDDTITGCVFAYQPKGAASQAASYSNLANPGTYDATTGAAPDFATGTGWTFNGTSHWLTSQYAPGGDDRRPMSGVARVTLATTGAYRAIIGSANNSGIEFRSENDQQLGIVSQNVAGVASSSSAISSGVSVVVGFTVSGVGAYAFYIDGDAAGSGTNNVAINGQAVYIGANGGAAEFWSGVIAAVAFYSVALTATNMGDLAMAMAAL